MRTHTIRDLVGLDGGVSPLARELAGEAVRLRGYLSPSLAANPTSFLLTEASRASCPMCGVQRAAPSAAGPRPATRPKASPARRHDRSRPPSSSR